MHYRAVRRSGMELGLACMVTGALLPIEKVTAAHIVGTSDPAQYSLHAGRPGADPLGREEWHVVGRLAYIASGLFLRTIHLH